MYIVKSGLLHVTKRVEQRQKLLAKLGPGDFFGEICLFDVGYRSASVTSVGKATLLEIAKEDFDRLIKDNPRIGCKVLYAMMQEMARRLRSTNEVMKDSLVWAMARKGWI
jgi:CRP-like cAMP-binding protein